MKTMYNLLDAAYPVIATATVRASIDGGIYRSSRPVNSKLRDVVILALPIGGGRKEDTDVQQCVLVINCHAKDVTPGIPDEDNLGVTTAAVISAIEAYSSKLSYLLLEITSQATMADYAQPGHSYSSLRVDCTVQFES